MRVKFFYENKHFLHKTVQSEIIMHSRAEKCAIFFILPHFYTPEAPILREMFLEYYIPAVPNERLILFPLLFSTLLPHPNAFFCVRNFSFSETKK